MAIILILFTFILINKDKKIKNLESILNYYKWHDALFDEPPHSGKYLIQIDDNKENIVVSRFDMRKKLWDFSNKEKIIAWCRLPNYLYPKKEFWFLYHKRYNLYSKKISYTF